MSDDGKIKLSFETRAVVLAIADLVPLKVLRAGVKNSRRYAQILGSVRAFGLVECPPSRPIPSIPDAGSCWTVTSASRRSRGVRVP